MTYFTRYWFGLDKIVVTREYSVSDPLRPGVRRERRSYPPGDVVVLGERLHYYSIEFPREVGFLLEVCAREVSELTGVPEPSVLALWRRSLTVRLEWAERLEEGTA